MQLAVSFLFVVAHLAPSLMEDLNSGEENSIGDDQQLVLNEPAMDDNTTFIQEKHKIAKNDGNGVWSSWSHWTFCSKSCGKGKKYRSRICMGVQDCQGKRTQKRKCEEQSCPVDGAWTSWGPWSPCTQSCGMWVMTRTRTCVGTENGGKTCFGEPEQEKICNTCPDGGDWGEWGPWSSCSQSCDGGEATRSRTCDGNLPCYGSEVESKICNDQSCPGVPVSTGVLVLSGGQGSDAGHVAVISPPGGSVCNIPALPTRRINHLSFVLGEALLACGGSSYVSSSFTWSDACIMFDKENSRWIQHSTLTTDKRYYSSLIVSQDAQEICILGGLDQATSIECWNGQGWEKKVETIPKNIYMSCAVGIPSGGSLIVGGLHSRTDVMYRSPTGVWDTESFQQMIVNRHLHSCKLLNDGHSVMVAGGRTYPSFDALSTTLIIDVNTKQIKSGPTMNSPRYDFALGYSGGILHAAGGHDDENDYLDSIETYDEEEEKWILSSETLPRAVSEMGVAEVEGNILGC